MTTQAESRYLQKLARGIDGSLSHHWITLEIIQTHDRIVTYRLVGSSGLPLTEPLKDLQDREYQPVAVGELPEQFKTGVYAEANPNEIPELTDMDSEDTNTHWQDEWEENDEDREVVNDHVTTTKQ